MTLVVLSVVVIALVVVVLAVYLFTIGVVLSRTADNLDDCSQSVKTIAGQVEVMGPAVERINKTGESLVGALPALHELAQRIDAELAPPESSPRGLGSMDV